MADHKRHSVIFPITDWEMVRQAAALGSEEARAALERLCQSYRPAIRACLIGIGAAREDVDDLTQEFLSRDFLDRLVPEADAGRGRFRYYILHGARMFMMSYWEKRSALKRGGGVFHEKIEDHEDLPGPAWSERVLDREWACLAFKNAAMRLRQRYREQDRMEEFQALWELLWADGPSARRLFEATTGRSPDVTSQRLRRFRVGLRECLWNEVKKTTCGDMANTEQEMAHMMDVLAKDVPAAWLYGCLS